jgi:hypothetical protein
MDTLIKAKLDLHTYIPIRGKVLAALDLINDGTELPQLTDSTDPGDPIN